MRMKLLKGMRNKRQEIKKYSKRIFYLCDRRACDSCDPWCHHTSNIRHAKAFVKTKNGDYVEKEGDGIGA